jgi:hypothetical protein
VCRINLGDQIGAKRAARTLQAMSDTVPRIFEAYLRIWVSINESDIFQCCLDILHAGLCIPEPVWVLEPHIYDSPVPTFPQIAAPIVKRVLDLEAGSHMPQLSN